MHTYRALRVHQHYDDRYPQEDFLEELEWQAPCLTSRTWNDTLLFGLQGYEFDIREEGVIKTYIYRDDIEIGKLFLTSWESFGIRKYAYHYRDANHGITTIRVYEEE